MKVGQPFNIQIIFTMHRKYLNPEIQKTPRIACSPSSLELRQGKLRAAIWSKLNVSLQNLQAVAFL